MQIPNFNIKLNQRLDRDCFVEFFEAGDQHIKNNFPQIKNVDDIDAAIRYVYSHYDGHIGRGIKILNDNLESLKRLAEIISQKLDYGWEGIPEIKISPCSFPICPRFIESASFLVTYYFDEDSIIGICAHEMIHFLYFKKIIDLSLNERIDTECPSKDWLLSEIFVQYISNSKEIRDITHFNDSLYVADDLRPTDDQLAQIKRLYLENDDLLEFRRKALEVL